MEQEILGGIVIGIVAGFFGWCLSQITIGRKVSDAVNTMSLAIQNSNNEVHRAEDEIAALRVGTDTRITALQNLVIEVLKAANNLIDVVRLQNELIREKNREK